MINRAALILRYNQAFVDWINAVDPSTRSHVLSRDEVNDEHTIYLLDGVESEEELQDWLKANHQALFESELQGWYTDPALWPKDRSMELLKRWCSLELHTVVVDTGRSKIRDDET
ncbi:MAG: hypothetical protein WD004_08200 [Actinomycetota bacterium]